MISFKAFQYKRQPREMVRFERTKSVFLERVCARFSLFYR